MTPLTAMERFVLQRMALGDTYREAGRKWDPSGTEERIIDRAKQAGVRAAHKLGARSITHAAVIALDRGLVRPEECGCERTYRWHIRHGEPTDIRCRGALAAVRREQRQGDRA